MPFLTYGALEQMTDAELVAKHDELAARTTADVTLDQVEFYRREMDRRSTNKATTTMIRLTYLMAALTVATLLLSGLALVVAMGAGD